MPEGCYDNNKDRHSSLENGHKNSLEVLPITHTIVSNVNYVS